MRKLVYALRFGSVSSVKFNSFWQATIATFFPGKNWEMQICKTVTEAESKRDVQWKKKKKKKEKNTTIKTKHPKQHKQTKVYNIELSCNIIQVF